MKLFDKLILAAAIAFAAFAFQEYDAGSVINLKPPIEGKGTRVLVEYDSRKDLPDPQDQALSSIRAGSIREWCDKNCAEEGNGARAVRVWDVEQDVTQETPSWQNAFKTMPPPPSIKVSNGRTGFAGPFPETKEQLQALLDKYHKD